MDVIASPSLRHVAFTPSRSEREMMEDRAQVLDCQSRPELLTMVQVVWLNSSRHEELIGANKKSVG